MFLLYFTVTVANDEGLLVNVPMSIVGCVIAPFSSTAKPLIVISPQANVALADCTAVVVHTKVSPTL